MASSKSKKSKKPSIPEMAPPDMVYKPMTADEMADMWSKFMVLQQEWAPALRQNQKEAQELLYRSMSDLQREQAPQFAAKAWELMNTYMPSYTMSYEQLGADLRNQLSAGVPQQFLQAYQGLGRRVNQGLRQGYQLGDELSREVEQGIRGAQTARGNYLGPALTAEEAMGRGQAALNMYNQRLAQAQGFLQGRTPTDVRAQITGQMQNYLQGNNPANVMGGLSQAFMGQNYYPQNTYVDTGLGMQGITSTNTAMSNYNQTLNTSLQAYNENQMNRYQATFDQYLFDQAKQMGLFSQPSVGGGGGAMGIAGSAIGAVGGIAGGLIAF